MGPYSRVCRPCKQIERKSKMEKNFRPQPCLWRRAGTHSTDIRMTCVSGGGGEGGPGGRLRPCWWAACWPRGRAAGRAPGRASGASLSATDRASQRYVTGTHIPATLIHTKFTINSPNKKSPSTPLTHSKGTINSPNRELLYISINYSKVIISSCTDSSWIFCPSLHQLLIQIWLKVACEVSTGQFFFSYIIRLPFSELNLTPYHHSH